MSARLGHAATGVRGQLAAVARDSALLAALRALGMIAGLLLTLLLARMLPPADFGAVAIAFSLALVGGRLATANIDAAAMRFVPEREAANDSAGIAAYLAFGGRLLRYSAAAIAAVLLLAAAGSVLWPGSMSVPVHLAAGAAAAPLVGWIRMKSMTVAALGRVLLAAWPQALLLPVAMAALTAAAWTITPAMSVHTVLALYLFCTAAVALLLAPLFRRALAAIPAVPRPSLSAERRRWMGAGLDLLIPTLFLELSVNTVVLIASLVLEADEVAALTVVLRVQAVILFGVTSINMVVAPRIARSHSNGDEAAVNSLLLVAAHLKLWPALLAIASIAVFGRELLSMFGTEYTSALLPLVIVCTVPIIMAVFGPVVLFVTILDLQRAANRIFQLAILALFVLIALLGHYGGVAGVAVAVTAVWLGWHVALYRIIRGSSRYSTFRLMPPQAA